MRVYASFLGQPPESTGDGFILWSTKSLVWSTVDAPIDVGLPGRRPIILVDCLFGQFILQQLLFSKNINILRANFRAWEKQRKNILNLSMSLTLWTFEHEAIA